MVLRVMQRPVAAGRLRNQPSRCCRCALVISGKVATGRPQERLRRLLHQHLRETLESRSELAGQWV